ncbi:squalene--hopene cyclase [Bacillus massilinigeriensis]|uniref:squalene--hopene cyclase n=1 Tax=Bacillus massilionigeriensis TaxID=1805475 RepID=UPI00096AE047|nr:squalene--hopene cyclase [Bacillus massilionigeriensis]
MQKLDIVMNEIVQKLRDNQSTNGSWGYPFETGISTDAYMIILLRTLEIHDEELIKELSKRILSKQGENGSWKLFADEDGEGNITSTVEAYYALSYSGYYNQTDDRLRKAKDFILSNGGLRKAHMFAKIMLALTGQYRWPSFFPVPVEVILLPTSFPINFYDFSVYGRANLTPLMILASKKFQIKTKKSPDLSDLIVHREEDDFFHWRDTQGVRKLFRLLETGIKNIIGLPQAIHSKAIHRAKEYMLNHLEKDGTLYSYYSATFLMIFALLSLGHPKNDPIIIRAVDGLKAMKCSIHGHPHMQYTTAHVWNTSLISFCLQNAGLPSNDPMIEKAHQYLLTRQHNRFGDWSIHNPGVLPGGFGFSDINTINPDIDDTTASLRSIFRQKSSHPLYRDAWKKGLKWLYTMQNDDGGWPSFEKNVDKRFLNQLPIEGGKFLLLDSSSSDLTGRTLEFIGTYTKLSKDHTIIRRGVQWLLKNQELDGSWYGRWGICYIYGTWSAVTGLRSVGLSSTHPSIQKAVNWLKNIQNDDGGWGESCKSDIYNSYIPLGSSHLTQTAWSLDALISASNVVTSEIEKGVSFLLNNIHRDEWMDSYPVGQGMGGGFYIHYHSYRYIYPLLALSNYKNKFLIQGNLMGTN